MADRGQLRRIAPRVPPVGTRTRAEANTHEPFEFILARNDYCLPPRTETHRLIGTTDHEMGLSWSDYCGSLCACGFSLDRTVVIRRDGTVLCVFGDRKPLAQI
jgi:hypothetical protein